MAYIIFTVFVVIFSVGYYNRDKTQDAVKEKNCDLW